ncbi:MAG: galactose-1-phosphate uridylyltransferase [Eggerthellaceae bacterium]|nr:galactose-1-phosphate uridylyltransferase [Eggerthellaceae bacterium]
MPEKKNIEWTYAASCGELELSVNISKPEKSLRDIADASGADKESCSLCWDENELLPGRFEATSSKVEPMLLNGKPALVAEGIKEVTGMSFAAQESLNYDPQKPRYYFAMDGMPWRLHYSPYRYFQEHCIVSTQSHIPMHIDKNTFDRLLYLIDCFPGYFFGSNADLPIVGGSILSHEHYQGGKHVFALMKAPVSRTIRLPEAFKGVFAGVVSWPCAVIRLCAADKEALADAASFILDKWQSYDDEDAQIFSHGCGNEGLEGMPAELREQAQASLKEDGTYGLDFEGIPHNCVTPIAYKASFVAKGQRGYVVDIVLRNNFAVRKRPWGIFHVDEPYHHIKKENIGLIEIMGKAILPGRLSFELPMCEDAIARAYVKKEDPQAFEWKLVEVRPTAVHARWAKQILEDMYEHGLPEGFDIKEEKEDLLEAESDFEKKVGAAIRFEDNRTKEEAFSSFMQNEVGGIYERILACCDVFRYADNREEALNRFIATLNE